MLRLAHLKALAVNRYGGWFRMEPSVREPEDCYATASGEIVNLTLFSSSSQAVGLTLLAPVAWVVAYSNLITFAEVLFKVFPPKRQSMAGEAVYFFLYEVPKVLLLLK